MSKFDVSGNAPELKLDYSLPIISIPHNKTIPFLKWYCNDISSTKIGEIPKVFDEGYITISHIPCEFINNCKNEYIKYIARTEKLTFREVENMLKDVYDTMLNDIIIHYEFIDNYPCLNVYSGVDSKQMIRIPLYEYKDINDPILANLGDIQGIEDTLIISDASCTTNEKHEFQNTMIVVYVALFVSAMWYMTLYKNRYKYENYISKDDVREVLLHRKRPERISSVKIITTSFYDLSKAPQSKVQIMIKKRAGFEYSHQFDVRGHYRHYKDGKIVFIESYTKAKDKPKLQKSIILNPEEKRY